MRQQRTASRRACSDRVRLPSGSRRIQKNFRIIPFSNLRVLIKYLEAPKIPDDNLHLEKDMHEEIKSKL